MESAKRLNSDNMVEILPVSIKLTAGNMITVMKRVILTIVISLITFYKKSMFLSLSLVVSSFFFHFRFV